MYDHIKLLSAIIFPSKKFKETTFYDTKSVCTGTKILFPVIDI